MICPNCSHDNIQGIELCESCGTDLAGLDLPEAERGFVGRLLTDRIGDLELSPALTASPETSVAAGVRILREQRHGCLLITDDSGLVGIFTERDLLGRVMRPGLDPETTPLREVMTPKPVRLEAGDPPAFAAHLVVARGFRHLPVVQNDELLGFVSVRNLLRYVRHDIMEESEAGQPLE